MRLILFRVQIYLAEYYIHKRFGLFMSIQDLLTLFLIHFVGGSFCICRV